MTTDQWGMVCAELEARFRGGLAEDREAILRTDFAHLDYGDVRAAVMRLSAAGQVFVPVPGEMHAAMRAMDSAPSMPFTEALPVILDELLAAKRKSEGRRAEALAGAVAVIAERCGEGAGRWAAARGFALTMEPLGDEDRGGVVRATLAKDYDAVCRAADEDGKTGLALSLAGRSGDGPRRIDPMRSLELPSGQ